MRYALPLVVPVALLVATALDALGRRALTLCRRDGCRRVAGDDGAGGAGVRAGRQPGLPCVRRIAARHPAPACAGAPVPAPGATSAGPVLGIHASRGASRSGSTTAMAAGSPCRSRPRVARARRALAVGARRARALCRRSAAHRSGALRSECQDAGGIPRWAVPERPFVGGARPGNADVYAMRPPGWMLDSGWALTAEVAGVTARDGLGPSVQPSIAWVRARESAADLVLGDGRWAARRLPA